MPVGAFDDFELAHLVDSLNPFSNVFVSHRFPPVASLGLCAFSAAAQEKVIVGHSARAALSIGPLLYGIERGFYRDEGIDLVYVSLRADLGIKALLAGEIDYSYSVGTIIRGAILGAPVRNLSFDFSRVLHALMSRPEIPNAAALKGKIVGVSSFGATGDLAARVGLRSMGLDPEKDVSIITLGPDVRRKHSSTAIDRSRHQRRKDTEKSAASTAHGARLPARHPRLENRKGRFHRLRPEKIRLLQGSVRRGL